MTSISPPMVGRYQLLGPLGKGGQGEVYEAHDTYENCRVALKLLDHRSSHPGGPWVEAVILRHLNDPHILPIRNADQHLGRPYLVTEVAEHGTVKDRLDTAGRCGLPVDDVVRWTRQACYGTARAHDAGLVHNDIKPGNLFLNAESECLVGDFGYAGKLDPASGLAQVYGASKETMAPEVAAGWATMAPTGSVASDVYSLGASAAWMLAGRTLHDFGGAVGLAAELSVVANVVPPRLRDLAPHVPVAVATAVERATARIPGDRYRSATDFAAALGARATATRRWARTDQHGSCVACWRGTADHKSTYIVCLKQGSKAKRFVISTEYEGTGRRVSRGAATATAATWPRSVRRIMRDLQ